MTALSDFFFFLLTSPPPLQEQALHAVHSIVMLLDKDTSPRPEKQPGLQVRDETNFYFVRAAFPSLLLSFLTKLLLSFYCHQMDMLTSMKALNKTVEASQLTCDLGGSFTYSHADWLQFHQVLNIHHVPVSKETWS